MPWKQQTHKEDKLHTSEVDNPHSLDTVWEGKIGGKEEKGERGRPRKTMTDSPTFISEMTGSTWGRKL